MKSIISLFSIIILIHLLSLNITDGQSQDDALPPGVIHQFKHRYSVFTVAFSPDGKLLASGGDNNTVKIWDVTGGNEYDDFNGHHKEVMSVAFSPDGKFLASACLDGFVRIWDVSSRNRHKTFTHGGWVKAVAFSPDAKTLASGGGDREGSVMLWDVKASQNRHITTFPGHTGIVESVVFSPDGQFLASTSRDKTAKLWDVTGQQMLKAFTRHSKVVHSAAFSSDGDILATSGRDYTIKLWKISSGEVVANINVFSNRYVYAVALTFSPDGKHLASACSDNIVRVWNIDNFSHTYVLRGHTDAATSIAFSPDGRTLASGSQDRSVLLWDLSHFNIVAPTPEPKPNPGPTADPNYKPTPQLMAVDTIPPEIVIRTPSQRVVPADIEQLPVRGIATDNNGISEVKVNGNETPVLADGRFTATVPLYGKEIEIRVTATDIHGNLGTKRFTVNRPVPVDITPPTILIFSPTERDLPPDTDQIFIQGKVTDDNSIREVKVNGQKILFTSDGRFKENVILKKGENEVRITATDAHGNTDTSRITVNVPIPPNPGPEIRILEPIATIRGLKRMIFVSEESVRVYGEVFDDDGIAEVKINGTKVLVRGKYFEKVVQLIYEDNVIHITATDNLSNKSEKKIIVNRPPNNRPDKDHALLFAVDDYYHWPNLSKPISDARKLQKDLENIYGFRTRLVENPTKADIFRVFREYAKMEYTDDSQLFIFYAGHGHFDDTLKVGHFVSRDTKLPKDDSEMLSYVSHSDIRDIIDRLNCKHIFLVLDTCYSGTFGRELAMRGEENLSKQRLSNEDIDRILEYTTRRYLTSGGKEQVPDNSPFVRSLLGALRDKGGVDNILTIKEILHYMEHLDNPKPCESGFGSDEPGSDFLFFAK